MRQGLWAAALVVVLTVDANTATAQGQAPALPGQWPPAMQQQQAFVQPGITYQYVDCGPRPPGPLERFLPPVLRPSTYFPGSATPQLPFGRRYFDGRYFGPLNDRFYGPQYGNF